MSYAEMFGNLHCSNDLGKERPFFRDELFHCQGQITFITSKVAGTSLAKSSAGCALRVLGEPRGWLAQ
jgi:hypothetical protein